jgi:hypothetical protein
VVAISSVTAVDIGPITLGPTPLAILLAVLVLAAIGVAVVVLGSQVAGGLVDKRWPANEPLSPSEVLWGESGGHVKKTFPGLDPIIGKDLAQYVTTRKVKPGDVILEEGDLPTQFVLLKSGAAERVSTAGATAAAKAGDSFGGDHIVGRTPYGYTLRATAPSEVLSLQAEDYLAAMAMGMSDGDDDYVVHVLGDMFGVDAGGDSDGSGRATSDSSAAGTIATLAPVRQWTASTHRVRHDTGGALLPAGDQITRTLAEDTEVALVESLPGWAHVRTSDGWQGWIAESAIQPY